MTKQAMRDPDHVGGHTIINVMNASVAARIADILSNLTKRDFKVRDEEPHHRILLTTTEPITEITWARMNGIAQAVWFIWRTES